MNYFVQACMGRKGGYVLKCTVAYSQGGSVRNFDFFVYAINECP